MRAASTLPSRLHVKTFECAISAQSRIKLRSVTSDKPQRDATIVLMQVSAQ